MALKSNNLTEAKRQELKALDDAIAERKHYLSEQQKLVGDMVEAGNMQLMSLAHDIEYAKQELRDLKTDVRMAVRDKVMLEGDLQVLRIELTTITGASFNFA